MSTTVPITWTTFPVAPRAMSNLLLCLHRFDTARDVEELLSDLLLADFVTDERELEDHVVRGVGGVAHGDHLGRLKARCQLEDSAVDLDLDIAGQQGFEDGTGVRLVDVVNRPRRSLLRRSEGQKGHQLRP